MSGEYDSEQPTVALDSVDIGSSDAVGVDSDGISVQYSESQHDSAAQVPVDMGDSANEGSESPVRVDYVDQDDDDGVLVKLDDAGKEDMFVDAPEELTAYDGRNVDGGRSVQEYSDEEHIAQDGRLLELGNLGKTVDETGSVPREYEEEREMLGKELASLHHQLKALTVQLQLPGGNDGGLVDFLHTSERGGIEDNKPVFDTPLSEMINECSMFVRGALEEQLQTEGTIRELHAILVMKDQEIEDLNRKVNELSVSHDVASQVELEKNQHIEGATNRMFASLGSVVDQEELWDDSVSGKITHVEKSTTQLIEKYSQFLSEIDLLRQLLTETGSDIRVQEGSGTIFFAVRAELLELKRKEADFVEKLNHLEGENRKLVGQLENDKVTAEMLSAELGKTKMELEQEKNKCANAKEKLSLAVTKGKALVQQRDALRQSLADKTSELEKCLVDLQNKSSALEAAELSKEELAKSESLASSLQQELSWKNTIVEKFEEVLSGTSGNEELQSTDILEKLGWLMDERNVLKTVSLEFHKLRDALSLIDLPETISSSDLESQVRWLGESFYQARDEINKLQDEISRTREAAQNEVDRLTTSLLAEIQEKDYLQKELEDLTFSHEKITEREQQISSEKHHMVRALLDASGITMDNEEGIHEPSSDVTMLIDRCLGKIKEQSEISVESARADEEMFERIRSLLYVRDQELTLCKEILEEEMPMRLEVSNLTDKLRMVSQELVALKAEKSSLQKDLDRSEEKLALLREKLSLAVKKGKGLVQERENLKQLLDEKNKEIEKLKLELQQQESAFGDYRGQIDKLSADVERIPKLEADLFALKDRREQEQESLKFLLDEKNNEIEKLKLDLQQLESAFGDHRDQVDRLSTDLERIPGLEADVVAIKDQRDQLEQFLVESNNILQRLIESIDGIVVPGGLVFEEPVAKVKWLAAYFSECEVAKTYAEQELEKLREETSTLSSKLAEAYTTIKSQEDALLVAEENISRLAEDKKEIEVGKTNVEQELQKAVEEAAFQASKFAEVCSAHTSLEDALAIAEKNLSAVMNEKEDAQATRAAAETELEKVKQEVAFQSNRVEEAYATIKSIEGALAHAEANAALLAEEMNAAQVDRANLVDELRKVKEEAASQAIELADVYTTVKSLEGTLSKAENSIAELVDGKKVVEQENLVLNSRLNACMEELAGTHGSLESRSVELFGHLNDLQMLLKDETLLSSLKQTFEKKFESLKDMDSVLKNIRELLIEKVSEQLGNNPFVEEDSSASKRFSDGLDGIVNVGMANDEANPADGNDISSYFRKTVDAFHSRNTILADKIEGFSTSMDGFIAVLLQKLQATRDEVIVVLDHVESLKQKMKNMEMQKQAQENTVTMLENDIGILLSACTDANQELQLEFENNLPKLSSVPELESSNWSQLTFMGERDAAEHQQRIDSSKYAKTAEQLSVATRKVQTLIQMFENARNVSATTIKDLQNELDEMRTTSEKAIEERDINQKRVSKLEADAEALQNQCNDMKLRLEDYQEIEEKLKAREAEFSSFSNQVLMKEREVEGSLLSASQVKALFDKIDEIKIPFAESEAEELEPPNAVHVKKLFHVIDCVTELQHQMNLLSHEKEELQSTLATQIFEIEHLRNDKQDSEKLKNDLYELELSLEKIIQKLGGNDLVGDKKSAGVMELLTVLEKLAMDIILESENSKSKAQELGAKLLGGQKVVDELSTKVKLLEDSIHARASPPEAVQERGIFEAPSVPSGSEISEIEDVGPLGTNTVSPVPSAAHVRTLRKGSTDHLALNIDSESDHLIKEETDEDKGHVFKSLNTSGFIPKQGKMIADRIDGIWVSGGRILMSRPRARLGLIAYWLFLHIWLLGTIL